MTKENTELKFKPQDLVVAAERIAFIGNPYHFKTATRAAFNTVESVNKNYFTCDSSVDLDDYFSVNNAGSKVVSQKSQVDNRGYAGKILHSVHDKPLILAILEKHCAEEQEETLSREQTKRNRIQGQISRLQEELEELNSKGIKTVCGQYYAKEFIENNKQTFLQKLEQTTN